MTLEDEFRLLVSGYYGIREMDEYSSKEYILRDLENYIRDFVKTYLVKLNFKEIIDEIEKTPLKTKLQDSLLVLNKIKAPLELNLLIKERLREIDKK